MASPSVVNDPEYCLAAATRTLQRRVEAVSLPAPDSLLALYAEDAILVPTVSNDVRGTHQERQAYFRDFLANEKLTCELGTFSRRVSHKLGTVVIGGRYTFTYRRNEEWMTIPARFLFTFEEIRGEWKITGHHSSQLA